MTFYDRLAYFQSVAFMMLNDIVKLALLTVCLTACDANVRFNNTLMYQGSNDKSFSQYLRYDQNYTLKVNLTSYDIRAVVVYAISEGGIITIGLDEDLNEYDAISGSSVAIVKLREESISMIFIYLKVKSLRNCTTDSGEVIDIIFVMQTSMQPIPGGCNLVQNANYYPLLTSNIDRYLRHVKFEPANVGFSFNVTEPACDISASLNKRLVYDIFVDFLPLIYENKTCSICTDFCETENSNLSLRSFSQMLTKHERGYNLSTLTDNKSLDFFVAHNPCMNSIVYVIVRDPLINQLSSYAPSIVLQDKLWTNRTTSTFVQIIMTLLMIAAFILCFVGHRLFAFELFMFSALFSAILFCIALDKTTSLILLSKILISSGIGILVGIVFVIVWRKRGHSEVLYFFLSTVGGYLFSSVVFVSPVVNLEFFRNYPVFLSFFVLGLSIYVLWFMLMPLPISCIVTSAFVGSYLFVFGLSSGVYLCSELSLIASYSLFRISNENFANAFVVFNFSELDIAMAIAWMLLFVAGIAVQFKLFNNHRGFPQSPYLRSAQRTHCQGSNESDSLSSRGPSFTSENYEGDVSDGLIDSVEVPRQEEFFTETTPLINK